MPHSQSTHIRKERSRNGFLTVHSEKKKIALVSINIGILYASYLERWKPISKDELESTWKDRVKSIGKEVECSKRLRHLFVFWAEYWEVIVMLEASWICGWEIQPWFGQTSCVYFYSGTQLFFPNHLDIHKYFNLIVCLGDCVSEWVCIFTVGGIPPSYSIKHWLNY